MVRNLNYTLAKIAAGAVAAATISLGAYLLVRDGPTDKPYIPTEASPQAQTNNTIQQTQPYESPKPASNQANHQITSKPLTLESIVSLRDDIILDDNTIYSALRDCFSDCLENTEHGIKKESFENEFRRIYNYEAEEVLAGINNETQEYREGLRERYGDVIDLLSKPENRNKSIEQIVRENGYNPEDNVNKLWEQIEPQWGKSKMSGAFPDVLAGRQFDEARLAVYLKLAKDYFKNKGHDPNEVLEGVKKLQAKTPEYMKLNDGRELTDEERELMQSYQDEFSSIGDSFRAISNAEAEEAEAERQISEHLRKTNPVFGLAREIRIRSAKRN